MKICYVTMQFPAPSETFCSIDINNLVSKGHELYVIGLRQANSKHTKLVQERHHTEINIQNFDKNVLMNFFLEIITKPSVLINLMYWVISNNFRAPNHLIKSLALIPSVVGHFSILKRLNPDVVHLFWGHYPSMLGHLTNKYLIRTITSQFLGAYDLSTKYAGSIELSSRVDFLFTHTLSNLKEFSEIGIFLDNVKVINRGIEINDKSRTQKDIGKHRGLKLLAAGRLIKEKGFQHVLNIFSQVIKVFPDSTLDIAGSGPYKPRLMQLAQNLNLTRKINFLGHVPQNELFVAMSDADFFLLLSYKDSERLPNVIKEAMYRNCIVISSKSVGISELIIHREDGFVVDHDDIDLATSLIIECAQNEKKREYMAKNARTKIERFFDVNNSMDLYLEHWNSHWKRVETGIQS